MGIRLKDLSKLGYRDNVARSLAVALVNKYCKHETKERILAILGDVLGNPEIYKNNEVWSKLAEQLSPTLVEKVLRRMIYSTSLWLIKHTEASILKHWPNNR